MICAVVLLYAVNILYLRDNAHGGFGGFCKCYLNDLICPLLLLSYTNILLLTINMEIRRLHVILLLCLAAGAFWELRLSFLKPQAVSDAIDILCYLAGGVIYWMICRLAAYLRKAGG